MDVCMCRRGVGVYGCIYGVTVSMHFAFVLLYSGCIDHQIAQISSVCY
jgi:hypothetical protein